VDYQEARQQREARRERDDREELVERIGRAIREDGTREALPGLHLYRSSTLVGAVHGVADPSFCVIAQGSKEVLLGTNLLRYDPAHYLLVTLEVPGVSRVIEASPERPYLAFRLALDPLLVASASVSLDHASVPLDRVTPSAWGSALVARGEAATWSSGTLARSSGTLAMAVSVLDAGLRDASVRLLRLLEAPPAEARLLAPLITQEIVFRLLQGEQGARLGHIAPPGGHRDRIARAVEQLHQEFDRPLRIDGMARELGMSVSGFHHHFKAVTSMSPLQFQKRLRLQEARRLMLGEDMDALSAGYRVGYDDASQFSREYKRLFGEPPIRDVERLRAGVMAASAGAEL